MPRDRHWHSRDHEGDTLAHRAAQQEERAAAGPAWEDHGLVFAQPNGRPVERRSDWQAWKTLLKGASVREVRVHDGRHTATTLLLTEGVHPWVVMELLGHAQMRTTTDTHSQVLPALAEAVQSRGTDGPDPLGLIRPTPGTTWPPRWHRERLRPPSRREDGLSRRS